MVSDIPDQMTVILANPPGGPEVMRLESRPVPTPGSQEVLIKVAAAGVNGADLREREGKYPVPPGAPDIMGLEVSGQVVALGEGCSRFNIGDEVCALLIGGGYAEYALAPEGQCMAIPPNVSLIDLKFVAKRDTSAEEINEAMQRAAGDQLSGILSYDPAPKVSVDFSHDPHSSCFAPAQTRVMNGTMVQVMAWYDNEWGFSCRMTDLAVHMGNIIRQGSQVADAPGMNPEADLLKSKPELA